MTRNPEPWWRKHYDENGEVGVQAATQDYDPSLWDSIKFTVLGDSKFK